MTKLSLSFKLSPLVQLGQPKTGPGRPNHSRAPKWLKTDFLYEKEKRNQKISHMPQRSQVSRIVLRRCSQNVLVFVFVFVIVFVFVFVFVNFFLVMSCLLITLVTCLKGHKSLRVLFGSVFQNRQSVSEWVSQWVTREPIELSGDS